VFFVINRMLIECFELFLGRISTAFLRSSRFLTSVCIDRRRYDLEKGRVEDECEANNATIIWFGDTRMYTCRGKFLHAGNWRCRMVESRDKIARNELFSIVVNLACDYHEYRQMPSS
jgi:hypothetical protein